MSQIREAANAPVALKLNGSRVLPGFRSAVFEAANRAGVSVNEYVLRSTAAELSRKGADIDGVFAPGDLEENALDILRRSFVGDNDLQSSVDLLQALKAECAEASERFDKLIETLHSTENTSGEAIISVVERHGVASAALLLLDRLARDRLASEDAD